MSMFQDFMNNGKVVLCDANAQDFAGELIWREIPFTVQYDEIGDIIFTDLRDDGK